MTSPDLTYHFEDTLTARDCKRHILHQFTVPAGAGEVELHHYAPISAGGIRNLLTLTLFDPNGFRGAGHRGGDTHSVRISAGEATPGYLPGPLPAGEWTVEVDTHMIMPGVPVHYSLDLNVGAAAAGQAPVITTARPQPPQRGPGWYRGDLHTHSYHSDAHNFAPADLAQGARRRGLDFVFLTDHNTASGLPEFEAQAQR